ncbi:MarR family winged helix-turn-helix transcriptional regulator [Terrabacter sp. BE26]|uniref:MarR family winged helix-turn-helix transcriptional regulator n=1 Tax=Terrabacter sp. BE26 TaxID=2898152 RepID=UPI0035BE2BEB
MSDDPSIVSDDAVAVMVDDLYDVVGLLRRRSRRLVGAPLPELALSGAQLELLRVVRRNPGVTVAEAARVLGLAPNTVSTLVGQLVSLEVLVRSRDLTDRRLARLELTPSAREGLERWRDRRSQATAAVLARLPAAERANLAATLPVIARIAAGLPDTLEPTRAADPHSAAAAHGDASPDVPSTGAGSAIGGSPRPLALEGHA